jgi:hypothetical protein
MAKVGFKERYRIEYGEDGEIYLNEPTNEQWSRFNRGRVKTGRKGRIDTSGATVARGQLFDALCDEINKLEDDKGPITLGTLDRIPLRLKEMWIQDTFELDDGKAVDDFKETEKNS